MTTTSLKTGVAELLETSYIFNIPYTVSNVEHDTGISSSSSSSNLVAAAVNHHPNFETRAQTATY
jgi:hypothetical protein